MTMRLENKSCVITGAGSGMGAAMATLFAAEGAKVVACDIAEEGVQKVIAKAAEDGVPGEIEYFHANVADRKDAEGMIDHALANCGRVDVVINNAGIMDNMMPVGEVSDELWEKVIDVNLYGVMYSCRRAVNVMTQQPGGGCIINVASVGGLNGARAGAAYTASKFGVVGLTRNIGYMYAQKGIRCNAICPGSIETNIGAGLRAPSQFGMERTSAGLAANPRMGQASEVAHAALFLASDDASFVNGTTVTVDGGWTAF